MSETVKYSTIRSTASQPNSMNSTQRNSIGRTSMGTTKSDTFSNNIDRIPAEAPAKIASRIPNARDACSFRHQQRA